MTGSAAAIEPRRHLVGDVAAVALVALAMLRCLVTFNSAWAFMAPLAGAAPPTEIGPIGTAVCDGLAVAVLLLALIDRALRGVRLPIISVRLWMLGLIVAAVHVMRGSGDPAVAGNWIGTLALAVAAMGLADVPRRRRFMLTALAALLIALALSAFVQYFLQHPRDVAYYEQHKAEFLEQRGWEPGAIQQSKWETRLYQREATGRFGLSNVFGTVLAALTVLAGGLASAVRRAPGESTERGSVKPQTAWRIVLGLSAALGLGALALTFSKGAAAALVVAAAVMGLARIWPNPWWWRGLAFGAVGLVIGVVVVRGMVGPPPTAAGERSLLFRAMYWQAAVTMVEDQPAGVGPGRFQSTYMRVKNPLSPEDVADPHNVFVTFIATLGLGGAMWTLMLLGMLWLAARPHPAGAGEASPEPPAASKAWAWTMALTAAAAVFGTQLIVQIPEMPLLEVSGVQAVTLIVFIGLVASCDRVSTDPRALRLTLFGVATVIFVHAQIEMSMNNTMSGPLLGALVGVAAGAAGVRGGRPTRTSQYVSTSVMVVFALVWFVAIPLRYVVVREHAVRVALADMAAGRFSKAAAAMDPDRHRVLLDGDIQRIAMAALDAAGDPAAIAQRAERLPRSAAANRVAAEYLARAGRTEAALAALDRLVEAAPYSVTYHLFAADLAWDLGRRTQARAWYSRTLLLNERAYLDPDAQLRPSQLHRIEARLADAEPQVEPSAPQRVR